MNSEEINKKSLVTPFRRATPSMQRLEIPDDKVSPRALVLSSRDSSTSSDSSVIWTRSPTLISPRLMSAHNLLLGEERSLSQTNSCSDRETHSESDSRESVEIIFWKKSSPRPSTEKNRITLRKNIATEFYSTERSYVQSLNTVYENFIKPLREDTETSNKPMLSLDDQLGLFSNWEVILHCHRNILDILEPRIKSWDENQKIGDIFVDTKNTGFIKLYKYYVNNFDDASALLQHYRQQKNFRNFCAEAEQKCEGRQTLESYLIMPVQRIPRYLLLLKDLIKHTQTDHVDYSDLIQAHAQIKAFADFINGSKKRAEKIDRVKDLYSRIEGISNDMIFTLGFGVVKYGLIWEERKNKKTLTKKKPPIFLVLLYTHMMFTEVKDEKKGLFRLKLLVPLSNVKVSVEDEEVLVVECTNTNRDTELGVDQAPVYRLWHEDLTAIESWYLAFLNTLHKLGTNHPTLRDASDPPLAVTSLSGSSEDLRQETKFLMRQKILKDFIKKEVLYLNKLKFLKQFVSSLAHSTVVELVPSVTALVEAHIMLLNSLWSRLSSFTPQMTVGDLFLPCMEGIQAYEQFCALWADHGIQYKLSSLNKTEIQEQIKQFETDNLVSITEICEMVSQRIWTLSPVVSAVLRTLSSDHLDFQNVDSVAQKLEQIKANIQSKRSKKKGITIV